MKIVIQNSAIENGVEIGRGLDLPDDIPEGEVIMAQRLANTMDVGAGDEVVLEYRIDSMLYDMCIGYNFNQPDEDKRIDCTEIINGFNDMRVYMPAKIH